MKLAMVCNKDDSPTMEQLRDNDPVQMMDLMAQALTAGKKVLLYQVDNSGVTVEREYPSHPTPQEPSVQRDPAGRFTTEPKS
jgi:hypothetical protein